jgi:hypothetical protein
MKKIQQIVCGACFFALLVSPEVARADFKLQDAIREFGEKRWVQVGPTRLKAGPLRIHPSLRNAVTFDDNVYLTRTKRRSDVIFTVAPGVIIELPIDKHQIVVGYEADFETLTINSHQNAQDQNFFSLVNLHFPSWYVNCLERFMHTSNRAGTTFTERIKRFDHSLNPKLGYKWKRATIEAGYINFFRRFDQSIYKLYNFNQNGLTGVFYYDLFARMKIVLDYMWTQIDYPGDRTRKNTVNQARIGFEGEIFPELLVKFRIGPQFKHYHLRARHNFNSWVGTAELKYQMRQNLRFELGLHREAVEATFDPVNYYIEQGVRFRAEYALRPQWITYLEFGWYLNHYQERATVGDRSGYRRDSHIITKPGLRYLFRDWMEFELSYQFLRRNSNFTFFNYGDHQVTFTSVLKY